MSFDEKLQRYFRSKQAQILEAATEAGTDHAGLLGSHRETIMRGYLSDLLPGRFEVGRGMVYGFAHRSREADIVIWDRHNYPSLKMHGHSLFFAESTRLVIEAKSRWSSEEFEDVLAKCQAVRDIVLMPGRNIEDDIAMLRLNVEALTHGSTHSGILRVPHHIATSGFFLFGGQSLAPDKLPTAWLDHADDRWPDVLLLLDAGVVVIKQYQPDGQLGGQGWLDFVIAGPDALMLFSAAILDLVTERTVQTEDSSYFTTTMARLTNGMPFERVQFRPTRPIAQRAPLWNR